MNWDKSFQREIPAADLFLSEQHKEAVARLEYIIKNRWFGLLCGAPGTGKSAVIRLVRERLDQSKYEFCYINDSQLKPKALYLYVMETLKIKPFYHLQQLKHQFHESVMDLYLNHHKQLVIMIDNAHNLAMPSILELRYLMAFEMDSFSPLALILVGQEEIRSTLRLRSYEPVFHCLNTQFFLPALNVKQTKDYIAHHLSLSGLTQLFPDDTIARIFSLTRGLPRLINKICHHCLVDLKANSLELVDSAVLERVEKDLNL